jgi:hypothetical protein
MKKTIVIVLIALHFAKMKVVNLLPFARSIHDNAGADPGVSIDPAVVTQLDGEIILLSATVTLRETNKSKALTKLEGNQATDVILTLTKIANSVQEQANAIIPGNTARATLAIFRIGFLTKIITSLAGRTFEIFKTAVGAVSIRVKKNKLVNLYHWRYSYDGITWFRLPDTTVVSIYVYGFSSAKIVFFQSAQTLKGGGVPQINIDDLEPDWSDSISAVIP